MFEKAKHLNNNQNEIKCINDYIEETENCRRIRKQEEESKLKKDELMAPNLLEKLKDINRNMDYYKFKINCLIVTCKDGKF